MRIREPERADAQALADMHIASWRAAYGQILPPRVIDEMSDNCEQRWIKYLSDPSDQFRRLLCDVDGRVAGFAIYSASRDEGDDVQIMAELCALYVHPDFWGRGLGRALCLAVLDCIRQQQWSQIIVWTLRDNHRARVFYEQAGFEHDGKTKMITLMGEQFPEVRYHRSIDAGDD